MCISTPIENWSHVYMNLFTRNSPYYRLIKYLLLLLKHPVYVRKINKMRTFSFRSAIFLLLPFILIEMWLSAGCFSLHVLLYHIAGFVL